MGGYIHWTTGRIPVVQYIPLGTFVYKSQRKQWLIVMLNHVCLTMYAIIHFVPKGRTRQTLERERYEGESSQKTALRPPQTPLRFATWSILARILFTSCVQKFIQTNRQTENNQKCKNQLSCQLLDVLYGHVATLAHNFFHQLLIFTSHGVKL